MNLYFLVEGGKTEMSLYPQWISYTFPKLSRVNTSSQAVKENYYIASGYGFSSIFSSNHLRDAIEEIENLKTYHYLVVCVDGDEEGSESKKEYIFNYLKKNNLKLTNCQLEIIVQNPCIETWLMGNKDAYPTMVLNKNFESYKNHYNVSTHDPELMTKSKKSDLSTKSIYHANYLTEMLKPKIKYSKSNPPRAILEQHYFSQMQKRTIETPTHLPSFQSFLQFCEKIKTQMQK